MEVGVIILVIVLLGGFVLYAMSESSDNSDTTKDNKLVMGDDLIASSTSGPEKSRVYIRTSEPTKKGVINHVVSTIYMCPENTNVWVCPHCECENQQDTETCCVCHRSK